MIMGSKIFIDRGVLTHKVLLNPIWIWRILVTLYEISIFILFFFEILVNVEDSKSLMRS